MIRTPSRTTAISRVLGAAACAVSVTLVVPGLAAATAATGTTLKVTGAGSGTLKDGPYSGCLDTNVKTNGLIAVNGLVGKISNFSNDVDTWSLDVTERKTGTFKFNGSYTSQPTAELFASAKDNNYSKVTKDQFFAKSGSVTVGSGKGSLNATFMNTAGKSLKVVGSWVCNG